MKVCLVNYEKYLNNGILTKYADQMEKHLRLLKVDVSVSAEPDPKADINHHINYRSYVHVPTKNTLMVTHITTGDKFAYLKKSMRTADWGVCFSRDTQEFLEKKGIKNLSTILPAHDGHRKPKIVAILTNVYPDGCKREEMLTALVDKIDKRAFVFLVMGKGWQPILDPLVANGLQVQYFNAFDYRYYQEILARAEYSLYFGEDEGSMGILDSVSCGLKTIAPNVGFHKDIGIDYPFHNQKELRKIFEQLAQSKVASWTWKKYAEEHLKLWEKLLSSRG